MNWVTLSVDLVHLSTFLLVPDFYFNWQGVFMISFFNFHFSIDHHVSRYLFWLLLFNRQNSFHDICFHIHFFQLTNSFRTMCFHFQFNWSTCVMISVSLSLLQLTNMFHFNFGFSKTSWTRNNGWTWLMHQKLWKLLTFQEVHSFPFLWEFSVIDFYFDPQMPLQSFGNFSRRTTNYAI